MSVKGGAADILRAALDFSVLFDYNSGEINKIIVKLPMRGFSNARELEKTNSQLRQLA